MGLVYRARQRRADRIVALKIIRPDHLEGSSEEQRQEWTARFAREAQAAARLEHDHLVTVYEVGEADGIPFYSMRYIAGTGLADVLHNGPLANRRAAACMAKVARAVDYAHRQGVLHRDLKPRNILIDTRDEPWVTDFGLAKCSGTPDLTLTGAWVGSPPYMAPEQIKDAAHVGPAVDIYSLGATLYHMLTGRPPFQAATVEATFRQVLTEEPLPPGRLNSAIPRDLEIIALKCLHKEPSWRYSSACELASDLERYLNDEPILARHVGVVPRLQRWCRRHRKETIFAGVTLVLLALLPLVAWAAYVLKPDVIREEKTYVPVNTGAPNSGNPGASNSPAGRDDPAALSDYYRARDELNRLYMQRNDKTPMNYTDRQRMHELERKYPDLKKNPSDLPWTSPQPTIPPDPSKFVNQPAKIPQPAQPFPAPKR
jgi:serine/threonine protein kinase